MTRVLGSIVHQNLISMKAARRKLSARRWAVLLATIGFVTGCVCGVKGGDDAGDSGTEADSATQAADSCVSTVVCDSSFSDPGFVCAEFTVVDWIPPPEPYPPSFAYGGLPCVPVEIIGVGAPEVNIGSNITSQIGIATFVIPIPYYIYACARAVAHKDTCWLSPVVTTGVSAFGDYIYALRIQDWLNLHASVGLDVDRSTGTLIGYVNQAQQGDPANAGFVVTLDSGGVVVYSAVGTPDLGAVSTDGWGGFDVFQVPPGPAVLTATSSSRTITLDLYILSDTVHLLRVRGD